MKKLEELGISPAPWKHTPADEWTHAGIDDANGCGVGETYQVAGGDETAETANACICAAAPDLYDAGQKTEAVLTGLFNLDEFAALLKSGVADALIACRDELRKALAKASGEESDNG